LHNIDNEDNINIKFFLFFSYMSSLNNSDKSVVLIAFIDLNLFFSDDLNEFKLFFNSSVKNVGGFSINEFKCLI